MKTCNFPLNGREGESGHCTLRLGHNGKCAGDPTIVCPDCDLLLPVGSPGGRCDRCEFTSKKQLSNQEQYELHREELGLPELPTYDPVEKPSHYNQGDIEAIDAIKEMLGGAGFKQYCRGQVLKYIWRAPYKGAYEQDLAKALWYLKQAVGEDPRE